MVVRRGQAEEISERRIITVLAVDMVGSTRHISGTDPEDAQAFFDACFARLSRTIERAGGRLVSYEGDGGIATFGWPVAFEDHADRACAAAWEIQHGRPVMGPDRRPALFRVGVNSGLAVVRQFRRADRPRFNTVGETVHLAAKLRQCAPPGGLLVSRDTVRLCRSHVDFSPGSPAGEAGAPPIECFTLKARPQMLGEGDFAHRYGMPMIGREAEFAQLRQALASAGPLPHSIALIGEPGIGKSRLAAAAVGDAASNGMGFLAVFGDAQKRSTPFAVPRALLADFLRSSEPGDDVSAILTRAIGDPGEGEAVASLLAARRGRRRDRDVKPTQTQLARALVKAFIALAPSRPSVLLVEDLHLVDQESRHFLRLLAQARVRRPLTLLMTGRPEARSDADEIAQVVINLEPMSREAMTAIARQLWPRGRPPGSIIGRIVERADGVPLVLEELVRSFVDGGGPADYALPRSVGSLVHARLQHLSADGRALAQTLSLLGERVEPDLAATVMDRASDEIADAFAELERFAFIHPINGPAIRMRHQIIAQACAETIPRDHRRELHRRAGKAIRAATPDLDGRYEQLAFHAEGADDLPAALECLWAASLEARRSSAAGSLNAIFDRAIKVIERIGPSADARFVDFVLMACASLIQLGEFEKVNRHLPRVMALARASDRRDLVCSTLSQQGMLCWFEGRYEEGLKATEEGLAMARAMNAPALIFSNTIMLTNILHDMGRVSRAIAEQRELCDLLTGDLETARLGATGIPRGTTLAFMSWYVVDMGAHDEGLDFAQRALDFARQEQDSYAEILARNALGRTLTLMGRNTEAASCLAVAREICDRDGYDAIKAHLAGRQATALARSGRPEEALRIVEDCLRQGFHLRTGQLEVFCLRMGHAEALVAAGNSEKGFAELEAAMALARRIDSPVMLTEALGLRARLMAEATPDHPAIRRDLAEQADLWRYHGFMTGAG